MATSNFSAKIFFLRFLSVLFVIIAAMFAALWDVKHNYPVINDDIEKYYRDSVQPNIISDTKVNSLEDVNSFLSIAIQLYKSNGYTDAVAKYLYKATSAGDTNVYYYIIRRLLKEKYYKLASFYISDNYFFGDSVNYYKGVVNFYNGYWKDAIDLFEASELDFPTQKAYYGLSLIHLNDISSAFNYIKKAYDEAPNDSICVYAYSYVLMLLNKLNQAKKVLYQYIAHSHYEDLFILMSQIYLKLHNNDSAKFYCQKALDINPNNTTAMNILIKINSKQGNDQEALKLIDKKYKEDSSTDVLYTAGLLYLKQQDYINAIASFSEYNMNVENHNANFIDTVYPKSLYYEAYCWHLLGNDYKASQILNKCDNLEVSSDFLQKIDSLRSVLNN